MDAIFDLSDNIQKINYEDLPPEAVEVTKRGILDTLGVTIAASGLAPEAKKIMELIQEFGGKEESTVLGFGDKVPALMAVFANGAMGHALDYGDLHDLTFGHPCLPTVAVAVAVAEHEDRKISGKEIITAVCLGNDVYSRLGLALTLGPLGEGGWSFNTGWQPTQPLGYFSGAATAGKLLRLTKDQLVNCFGIAYAQVSGGRESQLGASAQVRGMQGGFSGFGAVLSAFLAQKDITGAMNSLEGTWGLFNIYFRGKYDRTQLTADLGKKFQGVGVSFKAWPCCRAAHPFVQATLDLARTHDIHPQDVREIIVSVGKRQMALCEPLGLRQNPPTTVDAKFSIPFTVAIALGRRQCTLKDFAADAIKDPSILKIARQVSIKPDPQLDAGKGIQGGIVEIKTRDGKPHLKKVDIIYGNPKNPISKEDLIEKFKDCLSWSAKLLTKQKINKTATTLDHLEEVDDVREVIKLLY